MPRWLTRWILRIRATTSARHDAELRDELELHLRLLEEDYTSQGVHPDAARRRARAEFGNAALYQEVSHDLFSFRVVEDTLQDLHYAGREIRRSLAFTFLAVCSLAVGIGSVTAAFAVTDAFMFRSLPVRNAARLFALSASDRSAWGNWSYASFRRWRHSPDALFDVAAAADVTSHEVPLRGSERPGEVRVSLVSANYFQVMGVDIPLGRGFEGTENAPPGAAAEAVISDAFWERWFGRAPDVLTKTVDLHGTQYAVVGVARTRFTGHSIGHPVDVWVPLAMQPALMPEAPRLLQDRAASSERWLKIIGRVRDGVSVEEATGAAHLIHQRFVAEKAAQLGIDSPEVIRERRHSIALLQATTGFAPERARYSRPLVILSGITVLVLLVACANFTNLMLARSERRRREFAIRHALGGGRGRLLRQSAAECVVLAIAAGLLGLLFATWATTFALKQFAVMIMPIDLAFHWDGRVLAFAGGCVGVVIAFGIWPCTRAARTAALSSVYQSVPVSAGPPTRVLGRRLMLIGQLASCTVLLIAAGLLLRTVTNLRTQDLGFDRNVLLVSASPGRAGYSPEAAALVLGRVRERLLAVPGIQAVGLSGPALLDYTHYWIDGSQRLTTDRGLVLPGGRWTFAEVGPGFFEAVGMSLVEGRSLEERDAQPSADSVVINRSLATFLFGHERAIGRQLRMNPRAPMQSVVGVIHDARQVSPRDRGIGVVYLPLRDWNGVVLAVRTAGPPSDAAPVVKHQVNSIAHDLPIEDFRTISDLLDAGIAQERLLSGISLILATLVIAIGCVGLYALVSYDVTQRTHELGIRLALGATRSNVIRMVLRDSASLVLPALAAGIPLGIAASQPLSSQLYDVRTSDPLTVVCVSVVLAGVALLATLRPARSAARIDPIALLRHE